MAVKQKRRNPLADLTAEQHEKLFGQSIDDLPRGGEVVVHFKHETSLYRRAAGPITVVDTRIVKRHEVRRRVGDPWPPGVTVFEKWLFRDTAEDLAVYLGARFEES